MSELDLTLEQVRELVGEGRIVGDRDFLCASVASLERARPSELSFVRDRRYLESARASRAGALLVPEPLEETRAHQLVVTEPFAAFVRVLQHVAHEKRRQPSGIHPTAVVADGVRMGEGVTIGAGAVVREDVELGGRVVLHANAYVGQRSRLGADTVLHPNVVVMEDVTLGCRVIVHSGTVIGADGYGFLQHGGKHVKIPQVGAIEIGDDVEIGALTTIDRATVDTTVIGRGTKIGDLVHVAHNCLIGEDVLLLPTVAVSGSCKIGDRALLAGRAGVSDNVEVGEGAVLGGACVTYKDVPPGAVMWGHPAREKGLQMRIEATLASLPKMKRDLRALEKRLGDGGEGP